MPSPTPNALARALAADLGGEPEDFMPSPLGLVLHHAGDAVDHRFTVDGGPPTTLLEILTDNADCPLEAADVDALIALPVGEVHRLGGGAGAEMPFLRVE